MEILTKVEGIRIRDALNNVLNVNLTDILEEIDGSKFYWVILFLDGIYDSSIDEYKNEINKSENGILIKWKELFILSKKFSQLYEIVLVASEYENKLKRFKNEKEMYEACDFTIQLFDCSFWEIHSNDYSTLEKLKNKFNRTEWI